MGLRRPCVRLWHAPNCIHGIGNGTPKIRPCKTRYEGLQIGQIVVGKITRLADYGVIVELKPGILGLAHATELSWLSRRPDPSKLFKLGDEVDAMVLSVDESKRRLSFSIKRCLPNPWTELARSHGIGDKLVGTIKSIEEYGVFITLDSGIDGLARFGKDTLSFEPGEIRVGQRVEVYALAIDPKRERVALGARPLAGA